MLLALVILRAVRIIHNVCGLSGSTIVFHIIINGPILGEKFIERNTCFDTV